MVSIGHSASHIIPIIEGAVQFQDIKRINVGIADCFEIFQKNILIKYPFNKPKITYGLLQVFFNKRKNLSFLEFISRKFCCGK